MVSSHRDDDVGGVSRADHLATFPEQNPNAVIELDMSGRVAYLNPEAASRFPELAETGLEHPLMVGILDTVAGLKERGEESTSREVEFGSAVFEQKVCYSVLPGTELIRIYNHDVTAHRRAEQTLHDLARRVVDAQESERRRISRELHDEAGQALAALKISLDLLRSESEATPEVVRENLTQAIELVDITRERIRLLAHDLRPPALDALGLNDTLEDFCGAFAARTRLEITYTGEDVRGLDDAQEICLYRLLQEALTNVAIHAHATRVSVSLGAADVSVVLAVCDDGVGIDPSIPDGVSGEGIGLIGMRERLEMLGGRLEIESSSSGTDLFGVLPLEPLA